MNSDTFNQIDRFCYSCTNTTVNVIDRVVNYHLIVLIANLG